jgi:2-polyprenyl-3-methyl-5-hydroxy-6-metoxy-1,4-benzoquinol methylase
MTATVSHRNTCRLCGAKDVRLVLKLQPIPLSEKYATDRATAKAEQRFPVDVYMCADCGHVQHLDVINASDLWDSYTYFSGEAKGMPEHFAQIAAKIRRTYDPPAGSLVVDIGSNDGSLLKPFKAAGHRVLGIDPAKSVARRAIEAGIPTIAELMTPDLARSIRDQHGPAHVVCAFNVFAHADDLSAMAESIRTMLAPEGLFFFEAQYLLDIIDGVLIATIFHEHMSHHSLKPLVQFLDRHGLELIAVERLPIQHGSIVGTVQVKGGGRPVEASVRQLLALEAERRLDKVETLQEFAARVKRLREKTTVLVDKWRREGAKVAAYGAARSGPTLIAQLGLAGSIEYIVDDHPQKVGKYSSGDGIPIIPISELYERQPDYAVILAWVHAQKIIESNRKYLEKGGHFVVLCPETRIIGKEGSLAV